jgi:hypothetical protein
VTSPVSSPAVSPTAGFFNALVRHTNRRLRARIADLQAAIEDQRAIPTARDFADTAAAGYIDRTGLE